MIGLPFIILKGLSVCEGHKLPEHLLLDQLRLNGPVGETEFQKALNELKSKGYINFDEDEFTKDKRWWITTSGKNKLA
jgi:hypothetical protein